jgi:hypothetical protein
LESGDAKKSVSAEGLEAREEGRSLYQDKGNFAQKRLNTLRQERCVEENGGG